MSDENLYKIGSDKPKETEGWPPFCFDRLLGLNERASQEFAKQFIGLVDKSAAGAMVARFNRGLIEAEIEIFKQLKRDISKTSY